MLRVGFTLWFGMVMASLVQAQSMAEAAAQMAARISSLLQRHTTVSLEFKNLAALPPAESSSFRIALEEELRRAGIEMTKAVQAENRLDVTISENVRGLLFVAVVTSGENRQVAMLPWNAPPSIGVKPRVRISVQPIREQPEAVLDTLMVDPGSQLLLLGVGKVSSYRLIDGKWMPSGVVGIPWSRPLPRDPRGRLEIAVDGFRVYAPGTTCSGAVQPELKLTCVAGNEVWPANPRDPVLAVRWVTDRNVMESDDAKRTFYTSAAGWLVTGEGPIVDRAGDSLAGTDGWGSELVSIENPCAPGWLLLASKVGDAEVHEQIQAYEITEGRSVAASEPITFGGSVTALWPTETAAQATLVVRNSKTGNYEASRVGVSCAE